MASTATSFKSLSDAATEPLRKAYLAGGFGLTLLTLGAILMLTAFFLNKRDLVTYTVLTTGVVLVLFTILYVYFKDLRRLVNAHASIKSNKDLIDAVQHTAVELTELASDMQALAFKHANEVSQVLVSVRPILANIPIVSKIVEGETFTKAAQLSTTIVETTQKTRKVIEDLRKALIESNPVYLKQYLADIQQYRQTIEKVLATTR